MKRLRYVENAYQIMEEHKNVITNAKSLKGNWLSVFNNPNPLFVEFGSGRGGFMLELAKLNPEINYLAFERNSKVIIKGLNKYEETLVDNFRFVHADISQIEDIFADGEIDRIYLNFSDPWPKKKHAKRRLTHHQFLAKYKGKLKLAGEIHFKTDNDDLFAFSLEEINPDLWETLFMTRDLHHSDHEIDPVMTEYEEKFHNLGKSINKYILKSL